MTALPRAARWYIIAMWFAATALIVGTLSRYPLYFEHLQLLLLWLPLYVLADYFEVEIALDNRPPVFHDRRRCADYLFDCDWWPAMCNRHGDRECTG
jgi:hypothetical protein